jgi:hypothetical protein
VAKNELFYLGKKYDLKKKEILEEKLTYDPPDLTTHAIVTGMTGSGKTGLCIGLLEEAALQGIPALIIDPKGDLTNLVLAFPDLRPADFQPWIDKSSAKRAGKSVGEVAEKKADLWKKGLKDWGMGRAEITAYSNSVSRTIFTPGSTTGMPVNILASFKAPEISWDENEEILREKISATVTALLTLIGIKEIDPLRSREHILLANIIEHDWKDGTSPDLTDLIKQIQNPPINQLGAFSVNEFYPKRERAELAILLNNFLASPTFQSWVEGPPLDIQEMLYTKDGKPRHSIFYLAHLDDAERMFFITLLYSAVETWMRKQQGTGDLRAIIYFDEIHGYLPPVSNPPSKPLIIRLLKNARAFGVGLVLTTQNPVDIDYKGISNAGTWMIGRLQTDQDKQRLLDGLESAAGGISRSDFDKLISALGKRVFLYHNVHEKKPAIFHTRWVMSYLAGPLTITQIPDLNKLTGAVAFKTKPGKKTTEAAKEKSKPVAGHPQISANVDQYFLPVSGKEKDAVYQPSLLATAEIRYLRKRPVVDYTKQISVLVERPRATGQNWENNISDEVEESQLLARPQEKIAFASLPEFMDQTKWWSDQEKEFEHWIYETDTLTLRSIKDLGISAGPEVTATEFGIQVQNSIREKTQQAVDKLQDGYEKKINTLKNKIERQELKIEKYERDAKSRSVDTALKVGESIFKLVTKGKLTGVSTSSTKIRMAREAKTRLEEARMVLENYKDELDDLKTDFEEKKKKMLGKFMDAAEDISEVKLTPTKQNIRITHFGIAWKTNKRN